jgi:hypothetical protein
MIAGGAKADELRDVGVGDELRPGGFAGESEADVARDRRRPRECASPEMNVPTGGLAIRELVDDALDDGTGVATLGDDAVRASRGHRRAVRRDEDRRAAGPVTHRPSVGRIGHRLVRVSRRPRVVATQLTASERRRGASPRREHRPPIDPSALFVGVRYHTTVLDDDGQAAFVRSASATTLRRARRARPTRR